MHNELTISIGQIFLPCQLRVRSSVLCAEKLPKWGRHEDPCLSFGGSQQSFDFFCKSRRQLRHLLDCQLLRCSSWKRGPRLICKLKRNKKKYFSTEKSWPSKKAKYSSYLQTKKKHCTREKSWSSKKKKEYSSELQIVKKHLTWAKSWWCEYSILQKESHW